MKLHLRDIGRIWLAGRWHAAGADSGPALRAMLADAPTGDAPLRAIAARLSG